MRRIRFINQKVNGRYTWDALVYFNPKPKFPGVDFEDFMMKSTRDFATEAEAKADQEMVEKKLGLKF